jgi:anti-anti-sigma factor
VALKCRSMPLTLLRIPGAPGPIVRCQGDLTVFTVETLRRDLMLLAACGHKGIVVNVSALRDLDRYGVSALLEAARAVQHRGGRMALVASRDPAANYLHLRGADAMLPLFRSEAEALAAIEGPPELDALLSWEEVRTRTLSRWDAILGKVGHASSEELVRDLTGMFALCRQAEEVFRQTPAPDLYRCHFCPLFYELGGRKEDVGCDSAIGPLLQHVRQRDWEGVRRRIREIQGAVREMALPQ